MEGYHGFVGFQNDISHRGKVIGWGFSNLLYCYCAYRLKCSFSQAVAEMAAIGFGLPKDAFTSLMKQVCLFLI